MGVNVRFLKADIFNVDLKEKFDVVHSEGLIEHFYGDNRIAVFKKHVELCKENGLIVIFVPHTGFRYRLFRRIGEKLGDWIYDEEPLSRQELYDSCEWSGIRILKEYVSPLIHEIGILGKSNSS